MYDITKIISSSGRILQGGAPEKIQATIVGIWMVQVGKKKEPRKLSFTRHLHWVGYEKDHIVYGGSPIEHGESGRALYQVKKAAFLKGEMAA